MKCRKAYGIMPVGENDRSAHVAQQKAPEVATPGLFYSVLGGWLNPKAGYQLFFSVQPFADVVGNMDFGKESMEHEFERNARTAEAEQSKRAASRVKPTEPDRAGKQSAQRSVGDVERELRGIDEAVKSRTSKGRAEQAERRRAEQEAHQRAEAERRATEEQQRIASRRYIGRGWEFER